MEVQLTIDGRAITVPEGTSLRQAALRNGLYVPGLCSHPDLPPASGLKWAHTVHRGDISITGELAQESAGEAAACNLCLVAVEGEAKLVRACDTQAAAGLVVRTHGEDIKRRQQEGLAKILAHHPHACLTCAQREGCSLTQCSSNVPVAERCCLLLNRCELGKVVDYLGLPDGTPKYVPESFPRITDDPFFERNYNLCIGCTRCVRMCSEVRGVQALAATFKDDRVWVGTSQPGLLAQSYCRFCGACVEVCPTGALLDKSDSRPVHSGESAPCVQACPAGIDIPAYLRHIALGDYAGALQVIYDKVPFPGILGYVCFHPCESECKRSALDESLAICALKRFVYDNVPLQQIPAVPKAPPTANKIAVVGAGPAGLSAAFYLARAGHSVDVFEAAEEPGGMLRNALPEYRLPNSVLREELQPLFDLGVGFHQRQRLGDNLSVPQLASAGYAALLLALGTSVSRHLHVPGEDLRGVISALDFLGSVRNGSAVAVKGKVVIIGGGNVAFDAAMTARRLGAAEVFAVCLESREEMPAHTWEIQQAEDEGIALKCGWGPIEFLGNEGRLGKIRFQKCTRVFDEQKRFAPQYDPADTFEIEAEQAIVAIGQKLDLHGIDDLKTSANGSLATDQTALQNNLPPIFAAGDAVSGRGSVIEAIASGRQAADTIDRALGGAGIECPRPVDDLGVHPRLGKEDDFLQRLAVRPLQLTPAERTAGFQLIEQGLDPAAAQMEASRCLRCNLRATITPVVLPPDKWQPLSLAALADIPHVEGVYELAGGDRKATKISGVPDVRAALEAECAGPSDGLLFCWEADRLYSKRESELIQQHLQQYGQMPGGGAGELDDLF